MRSDLKKLDSFTLEMTKNYLIRNFLCNGRVRVNSLNPNSKLGNSFSTAEVTRAYNYHMNNAYINACIIFFIEESYILGIFCSSRRSFSTMFNGDKSMERLIFDSKGVLGFILLCEKCVYKCVYYILYNGKFWKQISKQFPHFPD